VSKMTTLEHVIHHELFSLRAKAILGISPQGAGTFRSIPCDISAQERGALSPYNSDEPESP
jgi:hypothetical protein